MFKEWLFKSNRPKLNNLGKLADTAIEHLLIVDVWIWNDFPEVETHFVSEVGELAASTKQRDDIKFFDSKFECWSLRDLLKDILDVFLIKIVATLVNDLKNFLLVVTLG